MKTFLFSLTLLIFLSFSCNSNKGKRKVENISLKEEFIDCADFFPKMKPIYYMKGLKSKKVKPFNFFISDSCITVEGDKFHKAHIYNDNEIYLRMSNDSIYSLTNYGKGIYDKNLFIVFSDNYSNILNNPFGSHKIFLKRVRENKYEFNLFEVKNTYDLVFNSIDSIELKKIIISKEYGFEKFIVRDKFTNETYVAEPDNN